MFGQQYRGHTMSMVNPILFNRVLEALRELEAAGNDKYAADKAAKKVATAATKLRQSIQIAPELDWSNN